MSSLLELLKQKKAALGAGNRMKTLKLSDGRGRYRILPSWRKGADDQFWHDFGQHYIKDAAGEMKAVYLCADKTYGRPCAVCDAVAAGLKSAPDDATMKALSDAKANGRVLVNALHLDGSKPGEVQILELPPTVFGQIVTIMEEWVEAGENPIAIEGGKDFVIERTGTGKNTKYTTQVAAKATVISADLINKLHNLDEYVAQENAEGEQRALSNVRSVAGLLPAPSAAAAGVASRLAAPAPAASPTLAAATTLVEDEYAVAAPPVRKPKPVPEFEDVPETFVAPTATAPAAAAEAPASSGDSELDALLAKLG